MPGAGNPQAWNRYAYVLYNPLRYIDPSGHFDEYPPERSKPTQEELLKNILERIYKFKFIGDWLYQELETIHQAALSIKTYMDNLGKSGLEWIKTYLSATFVHGSFRGNHYVTGNIVHLVGGSSFDKYTVVHELGHVLDNYIGRTRQSHTMIMTTDSGSMQDITYYMDATIFGGGPADDLFRAMGGLPGDFRFMNGDITYPYKNDVGVMRTLPDEAKFPGGQYGNYSSADYFAETFKAIFLGISSSNIPPERALNWMYDFLTGLN